MNKARVLVVEDDSSIRSFVREILQSEQYDVLVAPDGATALGLLKRDHLEPVDAILLDMRMPIMDGWQFARAYAASDCPRVPLIVFTADSAIQAAEYAETLGAAGFLIKPFDIETLLTTLSRIIGSASVKEDCLTSSKQKQPTSGPMPTPATPDQRMEPDTTSLPNARVTVPPPTTSTPGAESTNELDISTPDEPCSNTKESRALIEKRRSLLRLRTYLSKLQADLVRVHRQISEIQALEAERPLTIEERQRASAVRMENERLRLELDSLRSEFEDLRA